MSELSKFIVEDGFKGDPNSTSIVVLAGAGMDSFAVAMEWASARSDMDREALTMWLMFVDYGQRTAKVELEKVHHQVEYIYENFNIDAQIHVEKVRWDNNPQGEEGGVDYVPNRNLTFLNLAARFAEEKTLEEVGIGIVANHQAGDEIAFRDTTPQFLWHTQMALDWSSNTPPTIYAPFALVPKFVALHHLVNVMNGIEPEDWKVLPRLTYSCYHAHEVHGSTLQCGECSSCKGLKRAFLYADLEIPYVFDDHPERIAKTMLDHLVVAIGGGGGSKVSNLETKTAKEHNAAPKPKKSKGKNK